MVFSQLLEEMPGLNENVRHYIQHIKAQSDKLDWLIQSLIKLSRLETGMISLQQIEAKPLIQTLTQALSQIYAQAENKQITINIDCGTHILACHDVKWTSEALFNLLENAVKYTPHNGQISVLAESNEMFTCLHLTDTGLGIPSEEIPHIFKRFYRGKQAREFEGSASGCFCPERLSRRKAAISTSFLKLEKVQLSLFTCPSAEIECVIMVRIQTLSCQIDLLPLNHGQTDLIGGEELCRFYRLKI